MKKRMIVWLTRQGWIRVGLSCALLAVLVLIMMSKPPAQESLQHIPLPLSGRVIVVDPGHGGGDGGAVSAEGTIEKEINLEIGKFLRDYLSQAGALVVMTRTEDKDLAFPETDGLYKRKVEDLKRRVEIARENQADLFISVHLNAIPSSRWYGAQTFYNPAMEANKKLAEAIQSELTRNLENTKRFAKADQDIYLLRTVACPAALVEAGFLSNPREAGLLNDRDYQRKVAGSIYEGILRFYERTASKSTAD